VVDRLLQSCHDLGADVGLTHIRRVADSVVLDLAGPVSTLAAVRTFSALSVVLDPADPVSGLRRSLDSGVLSILGVRPPNYRVAPMEGRTALITAIEGDLGWTNAPSAWDVNVTTAGHHGELLIAQVGPLHRSRRFPALRRIPASANPLVAWLLVRLAKAEPGHALLDPFCGAGTILVEADAAGCAPLYGSDIAAAALQAARANLPDPAVRLDSAPAERLPHGDGSIDRIMSNLPFGKRVGSHQGNRDLYPAFLTEAARVLRPKGRAVLMTEDKRIFEQAVQGTHGIKVVKEITLSTGGLHPSVYVIERTRAHRRAAKRGARPR
jgi:tRNA (guanine6-N2)-methyltransferase